MFARADAESLPRRILIIRHAEKPDDPASVHLSAEGQKRAEALHKLFDSEKHHKPFPAPDIIIAAKDSPHSHRPTETVADLAKRLHLKVDDSYSHENSAALAHDLLHEHKYAGKTILICWHHGEIPELAKALKASDVPEKWKDPVFDRVWEISFDAKGKAVLEDRPQELMAGDSK